MPWLESRGTFEEIHARRGNRPLVEDIARTVVAELAPDELGLFPRRSKAFFRYGWTLRHRDPLGSGLGDQLSTVTMAAMAAAQTAAVLIMFRLSDVVGERASGTFSRWFDRLFRRKAAAARLAEAVAEVKWRPQDLREIHGAVTVALRQFCDETTGELIARSVVGILAMSEDAAVATTAVEAGIEPDAKAAPAAVAEAERNG